jgi:beta-glucosidase
MKTFPPEFLWGATASAHQVEGGNFHNDWWAWEQRPGRIRSEATSKTAADHAARFASDFALARKLGHNAHFFSLEWSRIQPEPDRFDSSGIGHYQRVFDALDAAGLTPVCVLHHVTLPKWFADAGGWHQRDAPKWFRQYAQRVAESFAGQCRWWVPIGEPMHAITRAYLNAQWPPGLRSWRRAWQALRNVARAHAQTYMIFHELRPGSRVGVSVRAQTFEPADVNSAWDLRAARRETYRCTRLFADALLSGLWPPLTGLGRTPRSNFDFLAVAPEPPGVVHFDWRACRNQCARELPSSTQSLCDADSFQKILRLMQGYHRPIMVAGDGIAADDDTLRRRLLLDHLAVVSEELDAGAEVVGYFHRALLDGFEWERGYGARYGLVHVDHATQTRTPNMSAYMYKDIIKHGSIRAGTVARYCPQ